MPEAVVARAVARALQPVVAQARVRLAAQVRAALVQRPHVQRGAVARRVLAGHELLARRVDQHDVGPSRLVVDREALGERERRVLGLDVVDRADLDLAAEAAPRVRPQEADRAGRDLGEPEQRRAADGAAEERPARDALDRVLAQRAQRLRASAPGACRTGWRW